MTLMRYRPANVPTNDPRLGRYVPDDFEHFDKFPLSSMQAAAMPPSPIIIGINFYSSFYNPIKDNSGRYWIGKDPLRLGNISGGHAMCLKPRGIVDYAAWWDYYNQYNSSRCVQFAISRAMTLVNRKQYEVRIEHPLGQWLYHEAQRNDEWAGGEYPGASPVYGGTSVRAGLEIAKNYGLVKKRADNPTLLEGISAFRWITSIDDAAKVLGYEDVDYFDVINSWGRSYPHLVRMPKATAYRVWKEDGEFGVITDR